MTSGVALQPIVSYPSQAQPGGTYLLTVDMRHDGDASWPYDREEFSLRCVVDTYPHFKSSAVESDTLVVHRFGGTYGAVTFVLEATAAFDGGSIRLTLVNEAEVPVDVLTLGPIELAAPSEVRGAKVVELTRSGRASTKTPSQASTPAAEAIPGIRWNGRNVLVAMTEIESRQSLAPILAAMGGVLAERGYGLVSRMIGDAERQVLNAYCAFLGAELPGDSAGQARVTKPTRFSEVVNSAIEAADAVLVLGGDKETASVAMEAFRLGKLVLPLPTTDGAAEYVFGEMQRARPRDRKFAVDDLELLRDVDDAAIPIVAADILDRYLLDAASRGVSELACVNENGYRILIDGSDDLEPSAVDKILAVALGAALALGGFSIVTFGTRGIAHLLAGAFFSTLQRNGHSSGIYRITNVMPPGQVSDFQWGRTLPSQTSVLHDALVRSDAVILVSDCSRTREIGQVEGRRLRVVRLFENDGSAGLPSMPTTWTAGTASTFCTALVTSLCRELGIPVATEDGLAPALNLAERALDEREVSAYTTRLDELQRSLPGPPSSKRISRLLSDPRRPSHRLVGFHYVPRPEPDLLMEVLRAEVHTVRLTSATRTLPFALRAVEGLVPLENNRSLAAAVAVIGKCLDERPEIDRAGECRDHLTRLVKRDRTIERAERLASLAREYEELRARLPSGAERTARIKEIVAIVARASDKPPLPEAETWFSHGGAGGRIVSLALLLEASDSSGFSIANRALQHPTSSFEQFVALRVLTGILDHLDDDEAEQLRRSLEDARAEPSESLASIDLRDRSRWDLSEGLLRRIRARERGRRVGPMASHWADRAQAALNAATTVSDALATALVLFEELSETSYNQIFLAEGESADLQLRTAAAAQPEGTFFAEASMHGIIGTSFGAGRLINVGDVHEDPKYIPAEARTGSELAVPILVRQRVAGVLNSESRTRHHFTLSHEAAAAALSEALGSRLGELGWTFGRSFGKPVLKAPERPEPVDSLGEDGVAILGDIARRYDATRLAERSSPSRTRKLDALFREAAASVGNAWATKQVLELVYRASSDPGGGRVVALAACSRLPRDAPLQIVDDALRMERTRFEQWAALVACVSIVPAVRPHESEGCVEGILAQLDDPKSLLNRKDGEDRRDLARRSVESYAQAIGFSAEDPTPLVRAWIAARKDWDGKRTVAVLGHDQDGSYRDLCVALGQRLASSGWGLVAGPNASVGELVASSLKQVRPEARVDILRTQDFDDLDALRRRLVQEADIAVTVSGLAGTVAECISARHAGTPVLPIAFTGNASAELAPAEAEALTALGVSRHLLALLDTPREPALAADAIVRILNIAVRGVRAPRVPRPSPVEGVGSIKGSPRRFFLSQGVNDMEWELARLLRAELESRGHKVSEATPLSVERDGSVLRRMIRASDYFVRFLSYESITDQWARAEVGIATRAHEAVGHPQILPIRVGDQEVLELELNVYLPRSRYAVWRDSRDTSTLIAEILRAADEGVAVSVEHEGTSPWDVPVSAESLVTEWARRSHVTLSIRAPHQFGKTRLLLKFLRRCRAAGKLIVRIDLQAFESALLESYAKLLTAIAGELSETLQPDEPAPAIASQLEMRSVMEALLRNATSGVVLAFDELDRVIGRPYQTDFFAMLRSWNARVQAAEPGWAGLSMALVFSGDHALISDSRQSPFNVGEEIELQPFTREMYRDLESRLTTRVPTAALEQLHEILGGHPALSIMAFQSLESGSKIEWILDRFASTEDGPFSGYLRALLARLHSDPPLLTALREALRGGRASDERAAMRLCREGVLVYRNDTYRPASLLYARFLQDVVDRT